MDSLLPLKKYLLDATAHITVLTGAGISAESGIPTFRGPEGYWTVGSRVYMPEEMATLEMFLRQPEEVWQWYLYRRSVCLKAVPNGGHLALAEMEHYLGDRFSLITQNIDNLHIRAGNTLDRTYQIHGNANFCRCSAECSKKLYPLAKELDVERDNKKLTDDEVRLLHCPSCDNWLRPHVLLFDEYYDEEYFRFESCMAIAAHTDLLITVGTSGATNLPAQVALTVGRNDKPIIDINIEENPFSELARNSRAGMVINQSSAEVLPLLVGLCVGDKK